MQFAQVGSKTVCIEYWICKPGFGFVRSTKMVEKATVSLTTHQMSSLQSPTCPPCVSTADVFKSKQNTPLVKWDRKKLFFNGKLGPGNIWSTIQEQRRVNNLNLSLLLTYYISFTLFQGNTFAILNWTKWKVSNHACNKLRIDLDAKSPESGIFIALCDYDSGFKPRLWFLPWASKWDVIWKSVMTLGYDWPSFFTC